MTENNLVGTVKVAVSFVVADAANMASVKGVEQDAELKCFGSLKQGLPFCGKVLTQSVSCSGIEVLSPLINYFNHPPQGSTQVEGVRLQRSLSNGA